MALSEATSRQRNFSIVVDIITGSYRLKTGFYGLGDLPNEFGRFMGSLVEHLPGVHVYLEDILIATRGSAERHWREVRKLLQVLIENNAAVKWSKDTKFAKDSEWLGFKLSNKGTAPVERKVGSILRLKKPENIINIRFLIGSMNQVIRFIPKWADAAELFRDLLKKHRLF